jgi:hypothetical protein
MVLFAGVYALLKRKLCGSVEIILAPTVLSKTELQTILVQHIQQKTQADYHHRLNLKSDQYRKSFQFVQIFPKSAPGFPLLVDPRIKGSDRWRCPHKQHGVTLFPSDISLAHKGISEEPYLIWVQLRLVPDLDIKNGTFDKQEAKLIADNERMLLPLELAELALHYFEVVPELTTTVPNSQIPTRIVIWDTPVTSYSLDRISCPGYALYKGGDSLDKTIMGDEWFNPSGQLVAVCGK